MALYNKVKKFDIYNGIVYRESFKDSKDRYLKESYDYTLALTYNFSKKLIFKLKGENLLDRAYETYISDKKVTDRERRILCGVEYSF